MKILVKRGFHLSPPVGYALGLKNNGNAKQVGYTIHMQNLNRMLLLVVELQVVTHIQTHIQTDRQTLCFYVAVYRLHFSCVLLGKSYCIQSYSFSI